MVRILLMAVVVIAIVGGLIFFFNKINVSPQIAEVKEKVETVTQPKELPAEPAITKSEIQAMIDLSLEPLKKQFDDLSKQKSTTPTVTQNQTTAPTTSSTSSPKTLYIPIGYGGSGSYSTDFGTVTGHEVTINPSDYPGYKQMVLEASFRIFQGNGKGEVRLYNKTDGTAVLNSVLSTTSQDYSTKTSSGFTLSGGSKTYTIQAKSSTGYAVDLQLTRVRIDF